MRFFVVSKIKVLLLIIAATVFVFAPNCFADGDACSVAGFNDPLICGSPGKDEEKELQGHIRDTLTQVYTWVGIIAVVVIVIGGILYMTSAGNQEKIKNAKKAITYAVIGLVVTLMAFAITSLVIGAIDGNKPGGNSAQGDGGGSDGDGGNLNQSNNDRTVVRGVKLRLSTLTLTIGDTGRAYGSVIPDYAADKTIEYSSSDGDVASIDENGKIKAKKEGETIIKATSDNGKSSSKKLTVIKPVEAESIRINEGDITLMVGKMKTLTATILPRNTANKDVTWSSDKRDIATVDNGGKIKGIKAGTATITVKTNNDKTSSVKVTVTEKESGNTVDTSSRHKIGANALAVMHADDNGDINKVTKAGEKKYYAIECDVMLIGGTLYCAHSGGYSSGISPTLADTVKTAKQYGMRIVLDHVNSSSMTTVAQYIKANGLASWVMVQLYDYSGGHNASEMIAIMGSMNGIVGTKLEYWGCHMSGMDASAYVGRSSELKSLGLTTVNVQVGIDNAMSTIKSGGFDLSVFTWGSFNDAETNKYNSSPYNAKYLMTNNVDAD